ncbi:MAG: hypothetical protein ACO201_00685 [Rickettsiales bacterium]
MSLLNFIAGGLGAGGRPNQVRTGLGNGLCTHPTSPTLSYCNSSAPTIAQCSPAQPNISPEYSENIIL